MVDIRKIQSILLCAVISCLRTRDKSSRQRTRKHFFFYPAIRRNRKIVSLIVGKRVIIYMRRGMRGH